MPKVKKATTKSQSEWERKDQDDGGHYYEYTGSIELASCNKRKYRLILLSNGMQVMLIHDDKCEQAAASMCVGAGYLDDPDEMQGMAHLCEHLIFSKIRNIYIDAAGDQSTYFGYIKSRSGSANAFTLASTTSYYFDIVKDHMHEALKLFSESFLAPDFIAKSIAHELEILDSEYKKNCDSDFQRLFQVFRQEALPGHPWRRFTTGSKESLTPRGTKNPDQARRDKLEAWWKEKYNPQRMALVILGPYDLNNLAQVAYVHFTAIGRDTNYTSESVTAPPSDPPLMTIPWGENPHEITFIKRITDKPTLQLSFCLPDQDEVHQSKPAIYACYLISSQDPGTLYSFLRSNEWITNLTCSHHQSARGFSFFRIKVQLTQSGFVNYLSVLRSIYAYLYLLPCAAMPFPSKFEEFQELQRLQIDYSQYEHAKCHVNRISESLLHRWPKGQVLHAPTLVPLQNERAMRVMFGVYLDPEAGRVSLSSTDFSPIGMTGNWPCEKWYGAEYIKQKLDQNIFNEAKAPNIIQSLCLPGQNEDVPTNFHLEAKEDEIKAESTGFTAIEFRQDITLPKGVISLYLRRQSKRHNQVHFYLLTDYRLLEGLLSNVLTNDFWDKLVAGHRFSFMCDDNGNLALQVGGYTDGMVDLFEELLGKFSSYEVNDEDFSVFKEKLGRELHNQTLGEPHRITHTLLDFTLRNNTYRAKDLLKELKNVQRKDLQTHLTRLLKPSRSTLVVAGNFKTENVEELAEFVDTTLKLKGTPDDSNNKNVTLALPDRSDTAYIHDIDNPEEQNSAVEYYIQVRTSDKLNFTEVQAQVLLLVHLMYPAAFKTLRTDKMLGYLAFTTSWVQATAVGLVIQVQGEKSPAEVVSCTDAFLNDFQDILREMTFDEFDERKEALISKLSQGPINLDAKAVRLAHPVLTDSNPEQRLNAEAIGALTQDEMINFHKYYVVPRRYLKSEEAKKKSKRSSLVMIAINNVEQDENSIDEQ
ncbi:hypothetical protein CPB86DRAFT_757279 [Serendipita vermifera]|nr:hypothetical protein CPB86DRAFT_757279 [Serendipita vermifera]